MLPIGTLKTWKYPEKYGNAFAMLLTLFFHLSVLRNYFQRENGSGLDKIGLIKTKQYNKVFLSVHTGVLRRLHDVVIRP